MYIRPSDWRQDPRRPGLSIADCSGPLRAVHIGLPRGTHLGGEVAYECGISICLMRPDGTGRRTLSGPFPLWDAAWSPDGGRLAFRGYYGPGDGQYDLYAVTRMDVIWPGSRAGERCQPVVVADRGPDRLRGRRRGG